MQVGDLLLIRPGAKVPVDAEVIEGESFVDESMVTGESLPVSKPGDKLIGATINKQGTLRARASAVGSDTALAQIVKLVQEAQNSKAPAQRLADRAAFWLVLVALIGGLGTFLVWYGIDRNTVDALLFAITVVVITCPDALGLATPTAVMVGTGLGARAGSFSRTRSRSSSPPRSTRSCSTRPSTLTRGEPEVVETSGDRLDNGQLLRLVAAVERERASARRGDRKAADERGVERLRAEQFESVAGRGAVATVDGQRVLRRQPPSARARARLPKRPRRPRRRDGRRRAHRRPRRRRRPPGRVDRDRRRTARPPTRRSPH